MVTYTFNTYDPAWAAGVPDRADLAAVGYKNVLQVFHSPTYHPNTVLLMLQDTEFYNESAIAVGRRNAVTEAWEQSTGVDKVARLDYAGDGLYTFRWDTAAPYLLWPPTSTKIYSLKHERSATADATNCWWVEWNCDYPFTFVQKSPTPDDVSSGVAISLAYSLTSNSAGTLVGAMHNSLLTPTRRQFSVWDTIGNTVAYYTSNDAAFGTDYSSSTPDYMIIDKNDHLWLVRASCSAGNAVPVYLDEYSMAVGGGTITLTKLNRYTLNDQTGGLNDLSIVLSGMTYHETDDAIVFHWNYAAAQNRITRFDLATRAKKLNDADSVRLYDGASPSTFLSYADTVDNHIGRGSALNEAGAGVAGLIGTSMNYDGDRTFGLWTEQDWTVYESQDDYGIAGDIANGWWLVTISTGSGTLYGPLFWDDFIDGSYPLTNPPGNPGVIDFNGSVYIPDTIGGTPAFWAGRFGDLAEGSNVGSAFVPITQGFGVYRIMGASSGSTADTGGRRGGPRPLWMTPLDAGRPPQLSEQKNKKQMQPWQLGWPPKEFATPPRERMPDARPGTVELQIQARNMNPESYLDLLESDPARAKLIWPMIAGNRADAVWNQLTAGADQMTLEAFAKLNTLDPKRAGSLWPMIAKRYRLDQTEMN